MTPALAPTTIHLWSLNHCHKDGGGVGTGGGGGGGILKEPKPGIPGIRGNDGGPNRVISSQTRYATSRR